MAYPPFVFESAGIAAIFLMLLGLIRFNDRFNCFFYETIRGQLRVLVRFYQKVGGGMRHVGSKYVRMDDGKEVFYYRKLEYSKPVEETLDGLKHTPAKYDSCGHDTFHYELGNPVALDKVGDGASMSGYVVARAKADFEDGEHKAMMKGIRSGMGIMAIVLVCVAVGGAVFGGYMYSQDVLHSYQIDDLKTDLSAANVKVVFYEKWFAQNMGKIPVAVNDTTLPGGGTIIVK